MHLMQYTQPREDWSASGGANFYAATLFAKVMEVTLQRVQWRREAHQLTLYIS
jgi:hypothetical protein